MTLRSGATGEEKRLMSPFKKAERANRNMMYQTISKLTIGFTKALGGVESGHHFYQRRDKNR